MEIDETATSDTSGAQEVNDRIEQKLFGSEEPIETADDLASEDAVLPEEDDTDSADDEGSDDVVDETDDHTLASYLGVNEDRIIVNDDNSVSLMAIVDGKEEAVPLSELAKSYQMQGHNNNKSMALEAQRQEFEAQKSQMSETLRTRVEGIVNLSKVAEDSLLADYNSIDWDRLRVENASEWSALRQEYAEKANQIQQMQTLGAQESQRLKAEQAQNDQANHAKYLEAEMGKLIAANPTWNDREVLDKDMAGIRNFLNSTYSFTEADLSTVSDHRVVALIQDAKAYREGKRTAETKKLKNVPKFQKPGVSKAKSSQLANARAVKARKAAVKASGSVRDVANLLLDRM